MSAELTVRQKILMAATSMATDVEAFSVEDLIVRSWKMYPESFSLRGFERMYPDSNRVLAKLSGADGLCGLGWLEHRDQRTDKLTRKGRTVARTLVSMTEAAGVEVPVEGEEKPVVEAPKAPVPLRVAAPPPAPVAVEPVAAKPAVKEPKVATPKAARPAKEPKVVAEPVVAKPAAKSAALTPMDVASIQQIAKGDALRKFLRGQPLSFIDACAFWGFTSASRATVVQERLELTTELLKRAVESFSGTPDPRVPPLATCYGLFNLNRLMAEKFSRELEGLRLPAVSGG